MFDLEPAIAVRGRIVEGVRDQQLEAPTPCGDMSVRDLLDHVDGLCQAFIRAATKTSAAGRPPTADGTRLGADRRSRIPVRLTGLAAAWRSEAAWTGMTRAGGVELPGELAAGGASDEIVVRGWNLATATGQQFDCVPDLIEAARAFVESSVPQCVGDPGRFGPPEPTPDHARSIDRLLGLTGRDPCRRPAAARP